MNKDFAWDIFEKTGNIECFLLYKEISEELKGECESEDTTDEGFSC